MSSLEKSINSIIVIITLFFGVNTAIAAKSRKGPLRTFGDYAQIINPLVAATLASIVNGSKFVSVEYKMT